MAGLSLSKGESLSINGKTYSCAGKGPGGRYKLIPHKGRVDKYLSADELYDLSLRNKIELHETSDYYREMPNFQVNLSTIPENQLDEVLMRHFYMTEMDAYRRNGGKLSEKPVTNFVIQTHKKYLKNCHELDRTAIKNSPSEATVRRWYRYWQKSGGNVLSLIRSPSGNTHSKLSPEQLELLEEIIKSVYLNKHRRSARNVHELMAAKIDLENRQRSANGQKLIDTPSYNTLCRHIQKLDKYEVLTSRFSHEYAYKMTRHQRMSPIVSKHLELVQADHTQADVYVDLGLGVLVRPWVTLLVDRYSEAILGFWISPYAPNADTVMNALKMAISPKIMSEMGGNTTWQWPMFGIPDELILDNGKDFLGRDLEQAAIELGITLSYSPPRQAFYKAEVEREFGKTNKRLFSKYNGQVYKYEPEKHGLDYPHLSFDEFKELFLQWIVTLRHITPNKDGYTPNQLWANSIQKNGFAGSGLEEDYVKLCLSKSSRKRFSIQPDGVHFNSLTFNNEWLSRYRNQIVSHYDGKNPTVEFKWSESDVGVIWVFDELNHTFFEVKSKQKIAHGRSFFNHKVVLREKNNRKKANLSRHEYHDAVLALENKIDEFTQAKGTKKLPAKAARYIKGGPNKSKRKINKPSQPELPRTLSNQSHSEEGADEFRTMKDELTDEIENIPDEIEF
ncbi:transposase family protein [Methylophaga sp.]|uniref:transposase family protein n=2 Tax=Methylophaga sp. TaxID=2024840 RepID=UPI002A187329|nr:transposase family protein [uncultured Methylophaga sp.]